MQQFACVYVYHKIDKTILTRNQSINLKQMMKKKLPLYLLLLFIFLQSCRKDLDKVAGPDWDPILSFPWIKTSMTLNDILPEDSSLVAGEDNLLSIIYRDDSIFGLEASDYLKIENQEATEELIRIDSVAIPDLITGDSITLWDMLDYLNEEARDSLLANNGALAIFPEGELITPYSSEFNAFENFEEAHLAEGMLEMGIRNELPVSLYDILIELRDTETDTLINHFSFPEIPPHDSVSDAMDLGGIRISNNITFSILSLYTPGSEEAVQINLEDGMYFKLEAKDLKMISGSGNIAEQDLETQSREIVFQFPDTATRLTEITLKKANLGYQFESQAPVDLMLQVRIPGGMINDHIPETSVMIPSGESVNQEWDLDGLYLDLSADPMQTDNSITIEYDLHVFGSDGIVEVDTSDFIEGTIQFDDLEIESAYGYFGKKIIEIEPVEFAFSQSLMENFESGIILDDPKIRLTYETSIGVPAAALTSIAGISQSGNEETLVTDSIFILPPQSPEEISNGNIIIDKENSNIVGFMANLPVTFNFSGTALTNNQGMQENFISGNSFTIIGFEMDLPLVLRSGNFKFSDTVNINYTSDKLDKLESALFKMHVSNGFPFDLEMQVIPLDKETFVPRDTLLIDGLFAAETDESGRVTSAFETGISIELDKESLFYMKEARKMIIVANMNTQENTGVAALYTDYSLDVKIGLEARVNN